MGAGEDGAEGEAREAVVMAGVINATPTKGTRKVETNEGSGVLTMLERSASRAIRVVATTVGSQRLSLQ